LPKQCAIIVNPTSGSYSAKKLQRVIATLQSHNLAPELLLTQGPDDAERFARRLCTEQEAPLIIAAGGDGTVNGVLNGLVPGRGTLAVLPLGTSNVLAKELGISSLPEAVERIIRGETRPLPVGVLAKGGALRYFSLMAGIGLDGAVVEGVRLREKRIIGKGAYLLAALRHLVNWESGRLHVLAREGEFDCHSIIVCNAAKYGGKFLLARQVDLFTPHFEVICVNGGSRSTYLQLALRLFTGRAVQGAAVSSFMTERLEIRGDKAIQLDGDFFAHAPVTISVVPEFARLIV